MLITNLSLQKKNVSRVNISVDDKFYGVLFDEVVYANSLKVGDTISEYDLNKLIDESNMRFCKNEAFNYLSRYIKTEKELKDYLYNKGYHKNAVEFALENIKQYNLIDDRKFAENYYNMYKDSKSNLAIKNSLLKKGISTEILEEVISYDEEQEIELATRYVKKLARIQDNKITYKNLNRLKRQLVSRGIGYEIISKVTADFEVIYEE